MFHNSLGGVYNLHTIITTVTHVVAMLDGEFKRIPLQDTGCGGQQDPFIQISDYIIGNKAGLQGQRLDAVDFYKKIMDVLKLPSTCTYNDFADVLEKHGIHEHNLSYRPGFIFPPLYTEDKLAAFVRECGVLKRQYMDMLRND